MSEKRFTESSETFDGFCDIFDNGVTIASMRIEYSQNVVNLLNSLNEENEELHIENTKLLSERIKDLEEFGECMLKVERMAQENLQLKTQINIFEKFLEENDLNVIDFGEFCTLDSCIFNEPNFDCRECIYIGVKK